MACRLRELGAPRPLRDGRGQRRVLVSAAERDADLVPPAVQPQDVRGVDHSVAGRMGAGTSLQLAQGWGVLGGEPLAGDRRVRRPLVVPFRRRPPLPGGGGGATVGKRPPRVGRRRPRRTRRRPQPQPGRGAGDGPIGGAGVAEHRGARAQGRRRGRGDRCGGANRLGRPAPAHRLHDRGPGKWNDHPMGSVRRRQPRPQGPAVLPVRPHRRVLGPGRPSACGVGVGCRRGLGVDRLRPRLEPSGPVGAGQTPGGRSASARATQSSGASSSGRVAGDKPRAFSASSAASVEPPTGRISG